MRPARWLLATLTIGLAGSACGDSSPSVVTTTETKFLGASVAGSWHNSVDGRAFQNVHLELTEAANGAVSGTWNATFVPCGCAVNGAIIPAMSSRKQELVNLQGTAAGYSQVDEMSLVGTMTSAVRLDLGLSVASSKSLDEWSEPLIFVR